MTAATDKKPLTLPALLDMHTRREAIAVLTCYDASFASVLDSCGVDVLLVGDSLGMVIQGEATTLPVTLEDMIYHVRCVARGARRSWVVADMPFGTYATTPAAAYESAARLMQAGAHMVKLEGGAWLTETVQLLTERSIPVCAHLGLTPQSVHTLGGYRVQGRGFEAAQRLRADALALQDAGATMLVLEMVPSAVAASVTHELSIPTIGIGAGVDCSGQVLVLHDMLGVYPGHRPRFVRDFMNGQTSIRAAIESYVAAVKARSFPSTEHQYE